jgi:ABC-type proline/glycine betaine transport system permease subunit
MGEYILKRFSITLILVSASLNIIFNISNLVQIYVGGLDFLDVYILMHLRFGELGIIAGFVGLYVSAQKNTSFKYLSLVYLLLGFSKFLLVEFTLIEDYGFWSVLLSLLMLLTLSLFILSDKKMDMPSLILKRTFLCIVSGIYGISFAITSIIVSNSETMHPELDVTQTILPFFYVTFLVGLWIYFYEYILVGFIHKNPMIRIQKNQESMKD